jgi:hypothetical protein
MKQALPQISIKSLAIYIPLGDGNKRLHQERRKARVAHAFECWQAARSNK